MELLIFFQRIFIFIAQWLATSILCLLFISHSASAATSVEYAIKAAYLYKLAIFVEWPNSAFATPTSAIDLCIVGDDPFGSTLDEMVKGQLIGSHAIIVHRLKNITHDSACHIFYTNNTDTKTIEKTLDTLSGSSVLTVTDIHDDGKTAATGIINFVMQDDHVRFDIDDEAASQNGLTISSKLLKLALNVKPRH